MARHALTNSHQCLAIKHLGCTGTHTDNVVSVNKVMECKDLLFVVSSPEKECSCQLTLLVLSETVIAWGTILMHIAMAILTAVPSRALTPCTACINVRCVGCDL